MELNILRKKIETLILKDETYASQMEHLVLPFLISRKEGFGWQERIIQSRRSTVPNIPLTAQEKSAAVS